MIISPAHAQAAGDTTGIIMQMAPLALILIVLYFLVIRPWQKKKNSEAQGTIGPLRQTQKAAIANSAGTVRFRNPSNGYEEEVGLAWLWCLLFGCIYFAVKGVWTHAVAAFLLAIITAGISWLVYPFFAKQIVERHYLRMGWQRVTG